MNKALEYKSGLIDKWIVEGHEVKPGDILVFDEDTKEKITVKINTITREQYKTYFEDNFLYSLKGDHYEILVIANTITNVIPLDESLKLTERNIRRKLTSIISVVGDGIWREVRV